ncbi:MAG: hypothetical protein ACKV2U_16685 [Bryobacteraceae bacterium]
MTESPTAAATAVLYNGRSAEMLVAYADDATGELHTLQFEETRADLGKVELSLRFDWERTAPPGASIVLPEAGQPLSKLDEYWLMWRGGDLLAGQSAHHHGPLSSILTEDEWLIDRPLVAGNQELHAYGWRGGELVRHLYAARTGAPRVTVDTVLDIGARPARSFCAPLPGADDGTALVGFVNEPDGGVAATAVYVRGGKVLKSEGRAEGRYRLMGRHRMGVHVGRKSRPALAVMTESHDDGSYALLEARFDFGKKECVWKRTKLETVPPGSLESAAIFYYKTQDAPEPFVLAVDRAGHLISPRRRNVKIMRQDVGAGYGYPILTTMTNRYEAVGIGGEITLRKL